MTIELGPASRLGCGRAEKVLELREKHQGTEGLWCSSLDIAVLPRAFRYEGAPAIREADLGHANAVDGTLPSRETSKAVHG
jgi:hypothetical protein